MPRLPSELAMYQEAYDFAMSAVDPDISVGKPLMFTVESGERVELPLCLLTSVLAAQQPQRFEEFLKA